MESSGEYENQPEDTPRGEYENDAYDENEVLAN